MSSPSSPPLTVEESDGTNSNRPVTDLKFNAADFTISESGRSSTVSLSGSGAGAALTDTYVGFGSASNLLTGSANFTFTEESGGTGPTLLLKGNKPTMTITDDTDATDYSMRFQQSGSSFYLAHVDSTGTDNGLMRLSSSYVSIQPTMTPRVGIGGYGESGVALKIEGTPDQVLRLQDTTDNYALTLTAGSSGSIIEFGDIDSASDSWMKFGAYSGANIIDTKNRTFRITGTDTTGGTLVEIESTASDATFGPELRLWRNSASPAASDYAGGFTFYIEDDGGGASEVGAIKAYIGSVSAGSESSDIYHYARGGGTSYNMFALRGATRTVEVNINENDVDFIANGDTVSELLHVDASQDNVGIGGSPTTGLADNNPELQILGSISNTCAIVTKTSATVDLSSRDAKELKGQLYVLTSGSAKTFTVPTSCTQGDWFRVCTTGAGGMDIVSTGGATLNGATPATLNRDAQNEIYTVVAIATNKWICTTG